MEFNLLFISSCIEFLCVKFVPKYLKSSTLSKELLSILYRDFVLHSDLETWLCTEFYPTADSVVK